LTAAPPGDVSGVRVFFRYFLKILAILPICRFKTAARFGKIDDILFGANVRAAFSRFGGGGRERSAASSAFVSRRAAFVFALLILE